MSNSVDNNLVVSMHYKLTDNDGNVLDTSEGVEPMNYLHGVGNIIPGLENALTGRSVGDTFKVTVEPADAYGEIVPELIEVVEREVFEDADSIEIGMQFQAVKEDGTEQLVAVKAVTDDDVTIDANHPLAGMTLNFEIEVTGIREATAEEIEHGHAH